MSKTAALPSFASSILLVQGKTAVLEHSVLLEQLALRCGQPGSMNWLQYFLEVPDSRWKVPYLVLILQTKNGAGARMPRVGDVRAAVLMLEYRVLGVRTGVVCTDDSSGFRTVIAPVGERAAIVAQAVQAVLGQGAQIVLATYDEAGRQLPDAVVPSIAGAGEGVLWARRRRPVVRTLALESTYAATLAKLGKSTRFNLGYYRRRLLAKMPCTFVADARGMLSERELRAVNAGSLNPVPFELFKLQYRSACHLPGGFVLGLRGPMGEWLSLIGGWRQGGATVLHWQTNASGHEHASLGTVMRSYFMEHEIAQGARTLTFYGGTPHPMQHAFCREHATDLAVVQRSWKAALLMAAARAIGAVQRRMGRINFVVETLSSDAMRWQRAGAVKAGTLVQPCAAMEWDRPPVGSEP